MSKVFILGNGPSRININISLLRQAGKVYGTNKIHFESNVDVLVARDGRAVHEVYHSGYAYSNRCYLAEWTPIPEIMYNDILKEVTGQLVESNLPLERKENKKEDSTEFVIHGVQELEGKNPLTPWTETRPPTIYISWIKDDKVKDVKDPLQSAVSTATKIACMIERPKQVYLMGVDNFADEEGNIPKGAPMKWAMEFVDIFNKYFNTEFIQVNKKRFKIWKDIKNLTYLDSYGKE